MSYWPPRNSTGDQPQTRQPGRIPPPPPLISEKRRFGSPETNFLATTTSRSGDTDTEGRWMSHQNFVPSGNKKSVSPPRSSFLPGPRSPPGSHMGFKRIPNLDDYDTGSQQRSGRTVSPFSREPQSFKDTSPFRPSEPFMISEDFKYQRPSPAKDEFRYISF